MKIRKVKISDLLPDPENVRKHDEKNLDAIKSSLDKFGQRKPIVVARSSDDRLVVIAGNGTLQAAKALGWNEIAVVDIPDGWTADQIKAFAIADNRSAELASWDDQLLASSLIELDAVGWDIKDLGFESLSPLVESKGEVKFPEKFQLIVDCDSAELQQVLLDQLNAEGYKVRTQNL